MAGPGHAWQSIYSKRLSRRQYRYGADCDVPDGDAQWYNPANTIEPSMCSGNAPYYGHPA